VSKASKQRIYPIRRPKERERDLLKELLEQERKQKSKEEKESRIHIRKDIPLNDTVYSHLNSMDGMLREISEVGE
jgi:hypothetical protein